MMLMQMIFIFFSLLLCTGFFTLLERKILSLSQLRLGPNKTMMLGMIQPILDGLKLMKKMNLLNMKTMKLFFFFISVNMLFMALLLWMSFPFFLWLNKSATILWLLLIFGMSMMNILFMGWSSMNKYSMLGSIRSLNQILSFEILFSLLIFLNIYFFNSFILKKSNNSFFFFFLPMSIMIILIIMDIQRTPMDLSEGESELVSGFNIEYSSVLFILVFLGEYMIMIFFSLFFLKIYLTMNFVLWSLFLLFLLLLRSSFPRIRFDQLMMFSWIFLLPLMFLMWLIYFSLKF